MVLGGFAVKYARYKAARMIKYPIASKVWYRECDVLCGVLC